MNDMITAELPADLAEELINDGFEEFTPFRGFPVDAGTIMTIASSGLAVGANIATIIVSREAISEFVATLLNWVRRQKREQQGAEIMINISARKGDTETKLQFTVTTGSSIPHAEATALTSFVTSLFDDTAGGTAQNTSQTSI